MSKKDKTPPEGTTPENAPTVAAETPAAPTETPVTPPEAPTPPAAPVEETPAQTGTIVAAPTIAEEGSENTLTHLVSDLPHLKRVLTRFQVPSIDEIDDAIGKLQPVKRKAFQEVFERMNPIKPGVHFASTRTLLPQDIKVFQGIGQDDMRPPLCPPGGIYTKDGRMLAVPKEQSSYLKIPTTFTATVINIYQGRSFWPPREGRDGTVPDGIHPHDDIPFNMVERKPYCRSLDRQRGDSFGDCASCHYRPFREPRKAGDCKDNVELYVVLNDFSGLYHMMITGTSVGNAGKSLVKWIRNWPYPWHRSFEFETLMKSEGSLRWFELQARPAQSAEFPEGIPPTAEEKVLYSGLSAKIDAELYFTSLATVYRLSQKAVGSSSAKESSGGPLMGTADDLEASIKAAEAAKQGQEVKPVDYSKLSLDV